MTDPEAPEEWWFCPGCRQQSQPGIACECGHIDVDRQPGETSDEWWERLALLCPTCTDNEGDRRDPEMLAGRIAVLDEC